MPETEARNLKPGQIITIKAEVVHAENAYSGSVVEVCSKSDSIKGATNYFLPPNLTVVLEDG